MLISMDSHTELVLDLRPYLPSRWHGEFARGERIARQNFGDSLRAFAHFMREDDLGEAAANALLPDSGRDPVLDEYLRPMPIHERLRCIDADGVAAEFITPFVGAYSDEPAFLHECTLAFDRWFQDYVSPAPYRFSGATAANLLCGIDTVVEEIDHAWRAGLRAIVLPSKLNHVAPDLPGYNARVYDPIWAALDERRMAAVFHAGHGREKPQLRWDARRRPFSHGGQPEPGWEMLFQTDILSVSPDALRELLFGAVPERYPHLRIGILESGATWIPPLLGEMDALWKSFRASGHVPAWRGELSPSEQWRRQGFVTSTLDEREIEQRHVIGVGNLMWGSDFPHVEGSYPNSRAHLKRLFAEVPEAERIAITGGNAAAMFGFDWARLAATPAAAGGGESG
ncbi:MAG: amidohydrolase family protein [Gammaproteobacteria bacterium]